MRRFAMAGQACALLLGLAGCATDAFERPGTWQPAGANEHNLRQMAADPMHLIEGIGAQAGRAAGAVPPITRLDAGERPELPQLRSTSVR